MWIGLPLPLSERDWFHSRARSSSIAAIRPTLIGERSSRSAFKAATVEFPSFIGRFRNDARNEIAFLQEIREDSAKTRADGFRLGRAVSSR